MGAAGLGTDLKKCREGESKEAERITVWSTGAQLCWGRRLPTLSHQETGIAVCSSTYSQPAPADPRVTFRTFSLLLCSWSCSSDHRTLGAERKSRWTNTIHESSKMAEHMKGGLTASASVGETGLSDAQLLTM